MDIPGGIKIAPVQDEAAMREFLKLPWRLYRDDPYWVPPVLTHQRDFLDKQRGPFFEIGEAQYFLARVDGQPAGRISAHINRLHDENQGPGTGFFGFFEAIPDARVTTALLEAAATWLRARGRSRLLGPLNFCVYDEVGLLVEGFDSMPVMFQTHNPPYYEDLLTSWGLTKAFDWHAYRITRQVVDIPAMERRLEEILKGQKVVLRNLDPRELGRRAEEVFQLFNAAWAPNWGHVPLTRRQFQDLFDQVKILLRPNLAYLLLDDDRLVGFIIALPDLNPLIKKLNGRLSPWGKLRLLYEAKYKPIRQIRALVAGISQPYQLRKLHVALILRLYMHLAQETPCQMADLSLIPENLPHWIKVLRAFGGERYKVFRVFERQI
jgi:GNAT superfamily N-acetyltransferase